MPLQWDKIMYSRLQFSGKPGAVSEFENDHGSKSQRKHILLVVCTVLWCVMSNVMGGYVDVTEVYLKGMISFKLECSSRM